MQHSFCELQTESFNSPSKHNPPYKVVLRWAKGCLVTPHCVGYPKYNVDTQIWSVVKLSLGTYQPSSKKRTKSELLFYRRHFIETRHTMEDKFELLYSFSCRLLTSLILLLLLLLLKAPEKLLHCITVHYILQKPKKQTIVKEGERRFDQCPPGMEIWRGLHQTLMLKLTSLQHQPIVCRAAASAGILVALDQLSSSHQTSLPTHSNSTLF